MSVVFVYKLFKYNYMYYSQGTQEVSTEYALLFVPADASFSNNRSTLVNARQKEYDHEIILDSVTEIKF